MKRMKTFGFIILTLFSIHIGAAEIDTATLFSRSAEFSKVKISPSGDYLSIITKKDGKNMLMVLDAGTKKTLNLVRFPKNAQVGDYEWVNDERLVLSKEYLKGWIDYPLYYGELMAINADGSQGMYLVGYEGAELQTGSRIKKNTPLSATAYILDPMSEDKRYMLINALPWGGGGNNTAENLQSVYRIDVYNGKRRKVVTSPISYADFLTDHQGEVRFVSGTKDHINTSLYYRQDGDWIDTDKLKLNLADLSPIAFTDDRDEVYVLGSEGGKPRGIYLVNIKTGSKRLVTQDAVVDPKKVWIDRNNKQLYAVEYENGYPSYEFVDKKDVHAKYVKQLLAALPGHQIHLVSQTTDASQLVIKAFNDRNPGDYYLFDTKSSKLGYLVSEKNWLDPELMAEVKPISFTSRDGQQLHGYLTLPNGVEAKNLPLVVNPHGGPHGSRDWWGFDAQNQMLANQGMAVLQINFRGSGGYGEAFEAAGYQKWGSDIQYDIIDGTRYIIEQGIADEKRICIAGGSFGGYSALQSATLAPELFQCAIGFAGIYDLEMMFDEGDIQRRRAGEKYLKGVLGEEIQQLKSMSPINNVDKLKAKLLLVHGGEDERAPIEQLESLEKALKIIDYPYQKLVMDDEGHGFYKDEHRAKYYGEMLSFLKANLQL